MVYEYMLKERDNEVAGTSKEERSARSTYGDKAVGKVQIKREGSLCTIKGKITPEHKLRVTPYSQICVINEQDEEILNARCEDCPASEGGCKHRIAFIMWVHRRSEEPSPTEVVSYWKKSVLSTSGLQPLRLRDISSRKGEETQGQLSSEDIEDFKNSVLGECSKTVTLSALSSDSIEASLDINRVVHNCDNFDFFINKLKTLLTDGAITHIEKVTKGQASNPKWHLLHYGRVTASKFYNVARCQTEDGSLLKSVLGEKFKSTAAMERGCKLEESVFDLLKTKFPTLKKSGIHLNEKYPLFGASPDGITNEAVFEIKCPSSKKTEGNYLRNGKIGNQYLLQLQLQMSMSRRSKGYFVVADPSFERNKTFTLVEVLFCQSLFEDYEAKVLRYYKKCIFPHLLK
ncbi:hypothetical protein M8J76_005518 [Diaphorina citri]|nr:hypothetical protein M8J75_010585 [Diaphorina citri]KAI5733058.1 hypothetical protein M8J76_007159 [Diaphorina citri]KAI5733232.1 hypothetical protein M8J76_009315 [Diaphorina citri]KAI5744815.1 hypothetical protein M8J76_005518 [Diaphorina citri]